MKLYNIRLSESQLKELFEVLKNTNIFEEFKNNDKAFLRLPEVTLFKEVPDEIEIDDDEAKEALFHIINTQSPERLLLSSGLGFLPTAADEDTEYYNDPELGKLVYILNMNDLLCPCSDAEGIYEKELSEAARLFVLYGYYGLLEWALSKRASPYSDAVKYRRQLDFLNAIKLHRETSK